MTGEPEPEREPTMDLQGIRRMHQFLRLMGQLHADLDVLALYMGLGRAANKSEIEFFQSNLRDLADHAQEMRRFCQEIVGLWSQGKHHAAFTIPVGDADDNNESEKR